MESSPFFDVPSSDWVASNRSAFAIRDKYPVTEGHTLVIPRRLISTWWEASPDERADLIALVDEVRATLDQEFQPAGYNVGFNAGEAAGQTVNHLHIHVIPRRQGDMPDPRGGVRHVIPERGNYLATPTDTQPARPPVGMIQSIDAIDLADGVERHLLPFLQDALADPRFDRIDVVVSFVRRSGVHLVLDHFRDAIDRGAHLRLLTTDYLGITEHAALEQLYDLAHDYPEHAQVRVFRSGSQSFHPKSYVFWSSTDPTAARSYVGSSNLTRSGLSGGVEWNIGIEAVELTLQSFDHLWADARSENLDRDVLDAIEALPRPLPVQVPTVDGPVHHEVVHVEDDEVEAPAPHQVQKEALADLAITRDEGQKAGLVVMATGLGKTYLAAFDAKEVGANRVLFVAHREEILQQARDSFRHVIPEASMGLFVGDARDTHAQFIFASVQSLARHLNLFRPDDFDYIVVDEFHHAAASTYRNLIEYFDPDFLLGLTATPDRLDGASILTLCNDNLVYQCDLIEGIRRDELSTFTYHGLTDPTDYADIPWRSGRFDPDALDHAVATQERAQAVHDGWAGRRGSRTLAFCVSTTHADFMAAWFREQGLQAAAVHSGATSAPRRASVRDLEAGDLDILFAVDVFNEGLNVPAIDTVMMLRPTSSPVIFLQQLGRGLRKAEGKDGVTVIDLVGNHDSFLVRPRTLSAMALGRMPTAREVVNAMRTGEFELPAGCEVNFDLEIIELLDELVRRRESQSDLLAEYVRSHLDEEGLRPTQAQALRSGLNPARTQTKVGWFPFLRQIGALADEELTALDATGDSLPAIERMLGPATKSYKQVTLRALGALGKLRTGAPIEEVAERSRQLMLRDPRLLMDVRSSTFPEPEDASVSEWVALWRRNPIQALTTPTAGDPPLFELDGDRLVPVFSVPDEHGDAFDAMVAELVDYRLAKYLADRPVTTQPGRHRYLLKVSHSSGKPIVRFDRGQTPELPQGRDIPFRADDREYRGDFVRIALNVARRPGEEDNALPDLLRGWFGPSAGHPGTSHRVVAEQRGEYWVLAPEKSEQEWVPVPLVASPDVWDLDVRSSTTTWLELSRPDIDPARDRLLFARDATDEGDVGDLHVVRRDADGWTSQARLLPSEFNRLEPHVGEWFRRDAVPELFGEEFNPGNWNTGHVTLDDDTVLFITLKGGQYANEILSDDRLLWYSQNSTTPDSKKGAEILEAMETGRRIHAFCRPGKGEFAYCGLVVPLEHESEKPIKVTFRLLSPLASPLRRDLGTGS